MQGMGSGSIPGGKTQIPGRVATKPSHSRSRSPQLEKARALQGRPVLPEKKKKVEADQVKDECQKGHQRPG